MSMSTEKNSVAYEVLSPWAEADRIAFKRVTPRLDKLDGKNIGLLRNAKRASEPTLQVVEDRLKKRFPKASFIWFSNLKPNERATATEIKDDFEKWVKEVDAVIAAYGD
jgi:Asp-tRNA(Asn)/Glu-tRNA(Gln) amidotransferase A subunit family amidase